MFCFKHEDNLKQYKLLRYFFGFPYFLILGFLGIFLLNLKGLSFFSLSEYAALGGIVPYSDASGYYWGANNLIFSGLLDDWNMRRPLNASFYAVRLWMSDYQFLNAMIIQGFLCGFSCVLVARELLMAYGRRSAWFGYVLLMFYSFSFITTTLSEALGLTLGALAFVVLWQSQKAKNQEIFAVGLFLLSVALNARAGAFIVLPLFVGWSFWQDKSRKGRGFILNMLGLGAAFLFNKSILFFYGDPNVGSMHTNFACVLYGLAAGGKTWSFAYEALKDNLNGLPEEQAAKLMYLKALELFKENPLNLVIGLLKSFLGFVKNLLLPYGGNKTISDLLKRPFVFGSEIIVMMGIYIIGVIRFIKHRKFSQRDMDFIALGILGIFLSSFIIWTDGGWRVFAVTFPFLVVGASIAIAPYSTHVTQRIPPKVTSTAYGSLIVSLLILLSALIVPKLIHQKHDWEIALKNSPCKLDERTMILYKIKASPHLNILPGRDKTWIPNISSVNFKKIVTQHDFMQWNEIANLAPISFGLVYDQVIAKTTYLMGNAGVFDYKNDFVYVCSIKMPEYKDFIVKATSVHPLNPLN